MQQDNAFNYDKGVLAEILEPIMGKGLIPADLETWKPRRRAIVPAFHKAYLEAMLRMFCACTRQSIEKFERLGADGQVSHIRVFYGYFSRRSHPTILVSFSCTVSAGF